MVTEDQLAFIVGEVSRKHGEKFIELSSLVEIIIEVIEQYRKIEGEQTLF